MIKESGYHLDNSFHGIRYIRQTVWLTNRAGSIFVLTKSEPNRVICQRTSLHFNLLILQLKTIACLIFLKSYICMCWQNKQEIVASRGNMYYLLTTTLTYNLLTPISTQKTHLFLMICYLCSMTLKYAIILFTLSEQHCSGCTYKQANMCTQTYIHNHDTIFSININMMSWNGESFCETRDAYHFCPHPDQW